MKVNCLSAIFIIYRQFRNFLNETVKCHLKSVLSGKCTELAWFFWFDHKIVDGVVNGAGRVLRFFVWIDGAIDRWVVDGLVNYLADQTLALGRWVRRFQTGQIQTYLGVLAAGLAAVSMILMSQFVST